MLRCLTVFATNPCWHTTILCILLSCASLLQQNLLCHRQWIVKCACADEHTEHTIDYAYVLALREYLLCWGGWWWWCVWVFFPAEITWLLKSHRSCFHALLFCSSKGIKVPMENCFSTLNCKWCCFHDSSNPSEAEVVSAGLGKV